MNETQRTQKNICIPLPIVNVMLDSLGYRTILDFYQKHILDIAAGNGAFLIEIVTRTINELIKFKKNKEFIKNYLEQYIHIIECNPEYLNQLENVLNVTANRFGIFNVKWDIHDQSVIENHQYVGMMDFVIGNIFYLSIENLKLDSHLYATLLNKQTNQYKLHTSKATEFYFEYGIHCLKAQTGKLIYLSSNTWLRSQNYRSFRTYLNQNVTIDFVVNFNFHDVFANINLNPAMTLITRQDNLDQSMLLFEYGLNDLWNNDILKLNQLDQPIQLPLSGTNAEIDSVLEALNLKEVPKALNLNSFIVNNNKWLSEWKDWLIDIYKTNTNTWAKLIYPYDDKHQWKGIDQMPLSLQTYLAHKNLSFDYQDETQWYGFQNSSFFKQLDQKRYVFNKTYDPKKEVFVHLIEPHQAVFDGIILNDYQYDSHEINNALKSESFLEWIQSFGKTSFGSQYRLTIEMLSKYLSWWFTLKNN